MPILAIAAATGVKLYRRTGSIYLGGILNALVVTMVRWPAPLLPIPTEMKLEWMGPTAPCGGIHQSRQPLRPPLPPSPALSWQGLPVSAASIQVLEYILENEGFESAHGPPGRAPGGHPGAFSKTVARLCAQGLRGKAAPAASGREYRLCRSLKEPVGFTPRLQQLYPGALFDAVFVELRPPPEALEAEASGAAAHQRPRRRGASFRRKGHAGAFSGTTQRTALPAGLSLARQGSAAFVDAFHPSPRQRATSASTFAGDRISNVNFPFQKGCTP